ncbi:hypothetical protein I6F40_16980 [Pseudoalteromonas sp. SWXJ133]|jgi:phage baseplate assembly protein gpV|uniref:hypothetical protein n=1 Tax=unclassified Pseudoalteromonas TaxID=194690 RepID=UPI00140DB24A|nr:MULTISPECIES: hypothetical protein [unclassified Pseudoalteromonas]MBH0022020.1 hypothetical protein [Pseudoalteromonas sp. SWXJ133]
MKFSLKKKNLKVLKSEGLNTNNILALEQTKMINGAAKTVTIRTSWCNPEDPDVQIPGSVTIFTEVTK